jgi:O-antigen/teichoic acid export membrane protein
MENPASRRAIARPTLVILAGSCAAVLASFAVRWAMARGLSVAGFGQVTLALALVSAAGGAATLGLPAAAARRVAYHLALRRPGDARGAARTALATAAAAGLLAAALLLAAAPGLGAMLGRPSQRRHGPPPVEPHRPQPVQPRQLQPVQPGQPLQSFQSRHPPRPSQPPPRQPSRPSRPDQPGLAAVLRALAPVAAALAVGGALVGISRGFADTAGRALLRDGLGGFLRLAGVAAALRGGAGPVGVGLGFAAGSVAAEAAFGGYAVARGWLNGRSGKGDGPDPATIAGKDLGTGASPPGPSGETDLGPSAATDGTAAAARLDGELLRTLPPFAAGTVLTQAGQWFDVLLLGAFASAGAVGVYGVARGVERALELASEAASHRFLPAATAAYASEPPAALAAVYRQTRTFVLALLWPAAAVCLLAPGAPVRALFGSRYGEAGTALALLSAGLLVSVALGYNDRVLIACGRAGAVSRRGAASLALGITVTLLAAPSWGSLGAAAGWTAMTVSQNLLWARRLWEETRISPWSGDLVPLALSAVAPALAVAAVTRAAGWTEAATAVAIGLVAATGSGAFLWRGWTGRSPRHQESGTGIR